MYKAMTTSWVCTRARAQGLHDQGQDSDDTNSEGKGAGRTDQGHDFVMGESKGEGAGR